MFLNNGKDLQIRETHPQDGEVVLTYLNQIGGESDNLLFGENEFPFTLEEEVEFLENIEKSSTDYMLAGFVDGNMVALVSLMGNSRKRIAHHGTIAISVREEYGNSGIATKLLQEIIQIGKSKAKMEILHLEVRSDNAKAIHIYEKQGFVKTGCFPKFFKINGEYYDANYMNLDL